MVVFLAMEPEMNWRNAHIRSSRPARSFGKAGDKSSLARFSMKDVKLMNWNGVKNGRNTSKVNAAAAAASEVSYYKISIELRLT